MDESKLLEENITINFNTLETILLSETVIFTGTILDFLVENGCVFINKVQSNGEPSPDSEQTGLVMIKSSLDAMKRINEKIWEIGKVEFNGEIPKELDDVVEVYLGVLKQIGYAFLNGFLKERE